VFYRRQNYLQNRQNLTNGIVHRFKKPMLSVNLNCTPILYNSGFFFPTITLRSQQGGDHGTFYDKWTLDYFDHFVREGSFYAEFYSEELQQTDVLLFSSADQGCILQNLFRPKTFWINFHA
jgi:hypothetical protein